MNLKRLFAFSLVFLVFLSIKAQGPDVEVWYEVAVGPSSTDTVNIYMRSAKLTPVNVGAVNFSMMYDSTCTQFLSFNAMFSTNWSTVFEQVQFLPFAVTYNAIPYNKRFSYGNNDFGPPFSTGPITFGPVSGPLTKVMTVVFTGICGQSIVLEHETQNSLNQIADDNIMRLDYNLFRINQILNPGLLSVTAEAVTPTSALISWEMAEPAVSTNFVVEKWEKGNFVSISPEISTPIQRLPSGELSYGFTDPDAAARYAVYRLRMIDQDGLVTWSDRVELLRAGKAETIEISMYPNPSTGMIMISSDHFEENPYLVRIYNTVGDQVLKQKVSLVPGKETMLNLTGFPAGPYQVIWEDLKGDNLISPTRVIIY